MKDGTLTSRAVTLVHPKRFFYGYTGCTGPKERAQAFSLSRSVQSLFYLSPSPFCFVHPPPPLTPNPCCPASSCGLSPLACYRPAPSPPVVPPLYRRCSQSITDKHPVRTHHASTSAVHRREDDVNRCFSEATDPSASTCTARGPRTAKGTDGVRWGRTGVKGQGPATARTCTCVTEV